MAQQQVKLAKKAAAQACAKIRESTCRETESTACIDAYMQEKKHKPVEAKGAAKKKTEKKKTEKPKKAIHLCMRADPVIVYVAHIICTRMRCRSVYI